MPLATVQQHRGSPTLFLDGEPAYPAVFWCPPPDDTGWPHAEHARAMAEAGVHIYTFGFGWPEPDASGAWGLAPLERSFVQTPAVDPEALFLPRFQLEAPAWWLARNPSELETFADGSTDARSYASPTWREDAARYLSEVVRFTRALPFGDRFLGYHVCAGWTAEWLLCAQNAFAADFHSRRRRAMSWARSSSLPPSSTWRSEGSARW